MKKLPVFLCCVVAALQLSGGCSKNTIYIDESSGDSGSVPEGATLVTFDASVESRNMTRALSPVRKDVQAEVFAYPGSAADASGTPAATGPYLSATPGLLQGLNGFRMYLPNGSYNFYAVSDNTQFAAPTFAGGKSEPLLNGIDYLWWRGLQQDVTTVQTGIPIVFLHCATQVIFEVQAGNGITINTLALAHIYPPVDGAQMDLSTGVITPATAFQSKEEKMGVSGLVAQYTMLPLKIDSPLKVSFDVIINGETTPRTYTVEVPVSLTDGELKAGDSYRFLAVIDANEVSFAQVSVTNWVDVDDTGKPLYPSEL